MTAHELARKLLEGPDVPVVLVGHDDTFDIVYDVSDETAWRFMGTRHDEYLFKRRLTGAPVVDVDVVVLR